MKETTLNLTCSVVVSTHNRPEALDRCLAAIAAGTQSATDVIVVDSAPKIASAKDIALRWGATYLLEPQPGVSRARNLAARVSTSDIIAHVDDDSVPEAGWLEPILEEFLDPQVALVGGRILPQKEDECLIKAYSWFGAIDLGQERRVIDNSSAHWFEIANFYCFVMGSNIAVRRSVYEHWAGFDERLGSGALITGGEESNVEFNMGTD